MSSHELNHRILHVLEAIEKRLVLFETGLKQVAAGVNIACDLIIKNGTKLDLVLANQEKIMGSVDDVQAKATAALAQITKNTDLDNSIIALVAANTAQITDLKTQLANAGTDPAKLQALSDSMDAIISGATSQGQAVADAVTANTPAADK